MKDWTTIPETITHRSKPCFTAHWLSGPMDLESIGGAFWQDEDCGGEDDRITIYGFQWTGQLPDVDDFEMLMHAASKALDGWIAERL